MKAVYTYDYADRQQTLEVQVGVDPPRPVVSTATYLPSGPLNSLTLGNGVVEPRLFDSRYFPDIIDVAGHKSRTWDYQTNEVGNITQIEVVACSGSDLVLDDRTVSTTEIFESCGALTVGPDFYVEAPGDATLRAVGTIGFRNLSSVGSGASLRVQPNADLGLPSLSTRSFGYQDYQYFLTSGDGPWGTLDWTYDTIGNRLSESRDGAAAETYVYETNTAGTGNRSRLDLITLGMMVTRDYTFGDAGHLEQVAAGANVVDFTSDDEGRLAGLERLSNTASMRYDGRSFLERVDEGGTGNFVQPTYSSEGLLLSLFGTEDGGVTTSRRHVLYFAGRPVGVLEVPSTGGETCTFLSTDHLGTPFVATDVSGVEVWSGGFEPFGRDWQEQTGDAAQGNGVFLRFPGQWFDETWTDASMGAEVAYNVHRWYEASIGRYSKVDPELAENTVLGRSDELTHPYLYASSRTTVQIDRFGLRAIDPGVSPECEEAFRDEAAYKQFLRDVAEAGRRTRDAPPCKNSPGPPRVVTVTCGNCSGKCGKAGLFGRICVNIQKIREGSCGAGDCFGSTTFHEFIHKCGGGSSEPMAWGCEKLFYGDVCRFQIPAKYKECPNPCS